MRDANFLYHLYRRIRTCGPTMERILKLYRVPEGKIWRMVL